MIDKGVLSPAEKADVSSVNAIVQALYQSVSFEPGKQPDYTRLRSLFHPGGHLAPPRGEKEPHAVIVDVDTFITRSREYIVTTGLERKGFFEKEISRKTDSFGHIVHVFSTYESRHRQSDVTPIQRGINSIQLLREGVRWWVVSIVWDIEQPNYPIPAEYVTTS